MSFRQRRSLFTAVDVGYSGEIGFQKSSDNGSETVDLGIKGRRAIVCASSKGLGRACAMALANEGVHVTLTARGAEALAKTAAEIRKANPGVTVTEVAGDITCVYRKLKLGRSGGEVRQGWHVI
jgi:hypothetical protein